MCLCYERTKEMYFCRTIYCTTAHKSACGPRYFPSGNKDKISVNSIEYLKAGICLTFHHNLSESKRDKTR